MINAVKTLYQRLAARRVFARWAASYDRDVRANRYSAARAVRDALTPYLGNGRRILDLGIGTGLIWEDMAIPEETEITGLDIAPDMLAQASANPDIGNLYLCDVGRDIWPVADGDLDMAVCAGLFEYLTEPMAAHVFDEARRTLKQGGLFIATYIPAAKNETGIWHGQSGKILSCRFAPEWMENQHDFTTIGHEAAFAGSHFADGSSYDYRLIILRRD